MTITLDAAGTLIDVRWDPVRVALECAREVGLDLDAESAGGVYGHLLHSRWGHYRELNLTRDPEACDGWWSDLTRTWLERIGQDAGCLEAYEAVLMRRLYGPGSDVFLLYEDTVPCLQALKAAGHRLAIVSNWDYSLHRVVAMLGIREYFDVVIASLEEGPEKPDPALFQITLDRLGVRPEACVHVGDNPLDDLRGAQEFGMRAILLDRSATDPQPPTVNTLLRLEGVV